MILLIIALFGFLLLLFAPRQSYPGVIAGLVPTYTGLYWIGSRPVPMTENWGALAHGIISMTVFLALLPAIGRFLFAARDSYTYRLPELDWRPAQVSCTFVIIWGAAWLLTPAIPVIAGVTICIAAGLLLSLAMFGAAHYIPRHRLLFAASAWALVAGMLAIAMWPPAIVAAAERQAAGRPYCLVVAHGVHYRPAQSLLDLTPLVMRGREEGISAANYHGELVIAGTGRRNWSYRQFDFARQAGDHEPPRCQAKSGFARHLPLF